MIALALLGGALASSLVMVHAEMRGKARAMWVATALAWVCVILMLGWAL